MRLTLEMDTSRLIPFVHEFGHPLPWTTDQIPQLVVMRLDTVDGATAAYVWLHFDPDDALAMAVHATSRPEFRGALWTPSLIADICALCRLMGAERLLCRYATDRRAHAWHRFLNRLVPCRLSGTSVIHELY